MTPKISFKIADIILNHLKDGKSASDTELNDHILEPKESDWDTPNQNQLNINDIFTTTEELKETGLIEEVDNRFRIKSKGIKVFQNGGFEKYYNDLQKIVQRDNNKTQLEHDFVAASNKFIPFQKITIWINLILVLISTVFIAYSIYQGEKKDNDVENLENKINKLEEQIKLSYKNRNLTDTIK